MKVLSFTLIISLILSATVIRVGTMTATPVRAATTCPTALPPGAQAPEEVLAVVRRAVPRLYPGADHRGYRITLLASLQRGAYETLSQQNQILRQIAIHQCGVTVANRSWLVLVVFPRLQQSASMYSAQLFVARIVVPPGRPGWGIWFRYH